MDTPIAATVLKRKLALVTRNAEDFNGANIEIINPWKKTSAATKRFLYLICRRFAISDFESAETRPESPHSY